jgi:hypothetical protein
MYLRDIGVYADEQIVDRFPSGFVGWFHRETCCITEWYVSLLYRKVLTSNTAFVKLLFTDQSDFNPSVRQLLNVADAKWIFDFAAYAELDEKGKMRAILDSLHAALLWIGREREWDTEALRDANDEMLEKDLRFESLSKKTWFSPNRKHKAKVGFAYGLRAIHFFVVVYDKKGNELGRKPLKDVAPEMGVIHWVLKQKPVWNTRNMFRIKTDGYCFHLPKTMEADLSDLVA